MLNLRQPASLCLMVVAIAVGCTIPVKPGNSEIPAGSITSIDGGPVDVRGGFDLEGTRSISTGVGSASIDEDEFTTAVLTRLAEQLREHGVSVAKGADRVVTLQVARVSVHPQPQYTCVIDFNRSLGDGPLRGLQSRAKAWSQPKACSAAVSQVVIDTLNDPQMHRYLKGE